MKKTFLFLACMLLFQLGFAQDKLTPENKRVTYAHEVMNYGIKGSFNLVNLNHRHRKIQPAFSIGAFANKSLSRRFALQAELLFCKKGFSITSNYPLIGINTMRNSLFYLNFNFLLQYRFLKQNALYFGLGADRLLFDHAKFTEPFPDDVSVGKITYNDPNRIPLSFTIGTSYKVSKQINIDLRYRRTVYSITDPHSARCNFIALGLEYTLKCKKQ